MTKQDNRAIMDKFPNKGVKIIGRLKGLISKKELSRQELINFLKKMKKVLDKREKT